MKIRAKKKGENNTYIIWVVLLLIEFLADFVYVFIAWGYFPLGSVEFFILGIISFVFGVLALTKKSAALGFIPFVFITIINFFMISNIQLLIYQAQGLQQNLAILRSINLSSLTQPMPYG